MTCLTLKNFFEALAANYLRSYTRQLQCQLEGYHCENWKAASREMEQEGTDMVYLTFKAIKNIFESRVGNF